MAVPSLEIHLGCCRHLSPRRSPSYRRRCLLRGYSAHLRSSRLREKSDRPPWRTYSSCCLEPFVTQMLPELSTAIPSGLLSLKLSREDCQWACFHWPRHFRSPSHPEKWVRDSVLLTINTAKSLPDRDSVRDKRGMRTDNTDAHPSSRLPVD